MVRSLLRSKLVLAAIASVGAFSATPALAQYTTNQVYDAARRVTMVILPDPDGAGSQLRLAEKYTYDADGRVTKVERGTVTSATGAGWTLIQVREETVYDAAGGKLKVTEPPPPSTPSAAPFAVTQFRYDGLGRAICTAVRMNMDVAPPDDACVLGPQGLDGPDRITRTTYDPAGQVTKIERGFGTPQVQTYATYSYTLNGQQATVADARGNLSTMEYDGFDRLAKLRFPVTTLPGGTSSTTDYEEYGYDAASNRTSVRRRDGQTITYTYDLLGREKVKDAPEILGQPTVDVYTAYDLRDLVLSARFGSTSGAGVVATYDKAGRMLTESTFGKTLTYGYDPAGNRTKVTWPETAFYVDYVYGPINQLTAMREKGATSGVGLLLSFTYDQLGRRTGLGRTHLTTTWGYDPAGRLTSLVQDPRTDATAYDNTYGFTYSPASQLLTRTDSNASYRWTPPAAGTTSNTYDGLNRDAGIVAVNPNCEEATAGYDCRGNLKLNGDWTYTYDIDNRLISANKTTGGTVTASLTYDPMGRLASTVVNGSTTNFLYDGPRLVAEYNAAGTTVLRRYAHGPGTDEPLTWYEGSSNTPSTANRRWLMANHQGSIVAWSNTNGQVQGVHKYGPWGETNNWGGSRFQYTGQITLPELQLYYYKARIYDPASGRFLQTDPIGYKDDLNLYAYVGGDPVNMTDPTGTCAGGDGPAACRVSSMRYGPRERAIEKAGEVAAGNAVGWGLVETPWIVLALMDGPQPGPADAAAVSLRLQVLSISAKNSLRAKARRIYARVYGPVALKGVQVHHRIPLEWAHLFKIDPNRVANLIGVLPKGHAIASREWGAFARALKGRSPTQAEVIEQALKIDKMIEPYVVRRTLPTPATPPPKVK